MSKLTLEEKRLQNLRMQLFGKEQKRETKVKTIVSEKNIPQLEPTSYARTYASSTHTAEGAFLQRDLIKVLILSVLAIGSQFLLYYLSLKGIIHLTVFHIF